MPPSQEGGGQAICAAKAKDQESKGGAGDAFNQVSIASSFTHVVDTIIALWLISDSCR